MGKNAQRRKTPDGLFVDHVSVAGVESKKDRRPLTVLRIGAGKTLVDFYFEPAALLQVLEGVKAQVERIQKSTTEGAQSL